MKQYDLLVLGGGPAGLIAAITAKKSQPQKKVCLARSQEQGVVPCGIPYVFNRLDSVDKDILPDKGLVNSGVDISIAKISKLDLDNKQAQLKEGEPIGFEKLIIATGSKPVSLPIKGIDKPGVFLVKKDMQYLKEMREAEKKAKNILIIGGGYIGIEIAEELSRAKDKNITIVERLDHCLGSTMDREFSEPLEAELEGLGITLKLGVSVSAIEGEEKCQTIILDNGESLPVDMVIVAAGARPNTDIAKEAGLGLSAGGAVEVDEYMRTNDSDVFAIGDCAQKKCLITKKSIPALLASTACYEARIAGSNVFKEEELVKNSGTLASFSTFINNTAYAVTGLTEEAIKQSELDEADYQKEESEFENSEAECACHHPGTLPDTVPIKVKMLFDKKDKRLVGAQLKGPKEVGEMINILALAIQKKATAYDLAKMQVATHPLLTPAPTVYPLVVAAQNVIKKSF